MSGGIVYGNVLPPASGGGGGLPGVTVPIITFSVGDGQAGSPVDGQTSLELATLQGQSLANKQLLVLREGVELIYSSAVQTNYIRRFNSGGLGGFVFEPAGGLKFFEGERYDIYIIGINNTTQV